MSSPRRRRRRRLGRVVCSPSRSPCPLLPGQTDAESDRARRRAGQGARREAFQDARRRAGIVREAVWIQPRPGRDVGVVYVEADDLAAAFTMLETSAEPFDRWFRDHVRRVHGVALEDSSHSTRTRARFRHQPNLNRGGDTRHVGTTHQDAPEAGLGHHGADRARSGPPSSQGPGWSVQLIMHDQADPSCIYTLVVFESEEQARAREQDPRRQEQLQTARAIMADDLRRPAGVHRPDRRRRVDGRDRMSEHPNVAVVRSAYEAVGRGDIAAFAAALDEDVIWYESTPGFEGEYHGPDEARGDARARVRETGMELKDLSIRHILADDDHAVVLLDVTMALGDRDHTGEYVDVYRLRDGKVTEHRHLPSTRRPKRSSSRLTRARADRRRRTRDDGRTNGSHHEHRGPRRRRQLHGRDARGRRGRRDREGARIREPRQRRIGQLGIA